LTCGKIIIVVVETHMETAVSGGDARDVVKYSI